MSRRPRPSAKPGPGPERGRALAGALVRWFRAGHRDMPWRRTRDPYAIWVSETMLQQTRVDAVVPYYERFLDRFPTVHALADAPLEDVLAHWAGLGYYRRARHLHAAAAAVVRDHGGRLPDSAEALRALPGVGRYTAGAIASIAFGRAEPIVDGNVARVLSRLFALRGGPGEAEWEKRLWKLAARLVPAADPSGFNQGLMELGATVCLPRAPRCAACPLARFCRAHAAGREEAYPPPKRRPKLERVARWTLVLEDGAGRVLLRRVREDEHNAGLWELPLLEPAEPVADAGTGGAAAAAWRDALRRAGAPAALPARGHGLREAGAIRHGILAREFRVRVFAARGAARRGARADRARGGETWEWIEAGALRARGLTAAAAKALSAWRGRPGTAEGARPSKPAPAPASKPAPRRGRRTAAGTT